MSGKYKKWPVIALRPEKGRDIILSERNICTGPFVLQTHSFYRSIRFTERKKQMLNFVTMITPYKKDGSVDYETATRYVDYYYESGLDGIFSVCQSSEIFYLSLEERVKLNGVVYRRAKELEKKGGRPFTVVSSGHVSDSPEGQAEELNAVFESGTDALILITNRLDPENKGDDVFLENTEKLISRLPRDAALGFYECPMPYKRLVTHRILDYAVKTGRFRYMKDTCCDSAILKERCEQLAGSGFALLNANCQTLLSSVRDGAAGYCGIMCNFHPRLYTALKAHTAKEDKTGDMLGAFLGTFGFTEGGLPYPLTAKYSMTLSGIPTEPIARNRRTEELTQYAKDCVREMKEAAEAVEKWMNH